MIAHKLTIVPSAQLLPREKQLAWHLATPAADPVEVPTHVSDMIANHMIDNAGVAITFRPCLPKSKNAAAPVMTSFGQLQWPTKFTLH